MFTIVQNEDPRISHQLITNFIKFGIDYQSGQDGQLGFIKFFGQILFTLLNSNYASKECKIQNEKYLSQIEDFILTNEWSIYKKLKSMDEHCFETVNKSVILLIMKVCLKQLQKINSKKGENKAAKNFKNKYALESKHILDSIFMQEDFMQELKASLRAMIKEKDDHLR